MTDPASTLTHGLGAIVFAVLGALLIVRAKGSVLRIVSLAMFVASAVFLLSMSAVFHGLPPGTGREVLKRLDHAGIFLLIAGTFTPIHMILFRGVLRWGVLAFIWACAIAGLTLKTIFFSSMPEWLGVTVYLGMGWVGALTMGFIWRRYGFAFVSPLIWGGLAYTVGALCEFTGEPVLARGVFGAHEMFHVAVLVGLGSMWWFIHRIAAGAPPRLERSVRAPAMPAPAG